MVKPVNGKNTAGYTKVILNDNATKQKKTFLVPVGKQLVAGNKTYDLSKGEVVINSNDNPKGFKMIGVTLEHFDTNKDGKIDQKDTELAVGDKIHKDKNKPAGYDLMDNGLDYDAYVEKGEGYANYTKDNKNFFEVRIEKAKK